MNFGAFKTEKRADGMTMVRFPEGEPYIASNVEIFCFERIERLETALKTIADGCPNADLIARQALET